MANHSPETIRRGEDVLRTAAAHINGDAEALRLVLTRYVEGLHKFPEAEDFLAASLAIVVSLIIELATVTSVTPEALIDELLLELT